jgi:F-type H+-transporting ATPase subunit alpha
VGGAAQTKAIRRVAGRLRLDLAQYRELATFAAFGTADLDRATRAQLERGQRSTEILKQLQYQPMALDKEVIILFAANNGDLDDVSIDRCQRFEEGLLRYIETARPEIGRAISQTRELAGETEASLKAAIQEFKATFNLPQGSAS